MSEYLSLSGIASNDNSLVMLRSAHLTQNGEEDESRRAILGAFVKHSTSRGRGVAVGLFDNVVKKGLGGALGGALGGKVTEALEQATGMDLNGDGQSGSAGSVFGSQQQGTTVPGQQQAYQQQAAPAQYTQQGQYAQQVTDKAYFRTIIKEVFSGYIVREDMPVSELGGEGRPYDFALIAGGECAGVVMLVEHNRDNNRAYKGARAAAQAAGVPFINFYTHMTNERGFVINRIKRLAKPLV